MLDLYEHSLYYDLLVCMHFVRNQSSLGTVHVVFQGYEDTSMEKKFFSNESVLNSSLKRFKTL